MHNLLYVFYLFIIRTTQKFFLSYFHYGITLRGMLKPKSFATDTYKQSQAPPTLFLNEPELRYVFKFQYKKSEAPVNQINVNLLYTQT